jgi:hypothetical protein
MKKVLFGIFIFLVSVNSFAQDEASNEEPIKITRYGIKTGICMAHFHNTHQLDLVYNDSYNNLSGFSGGFFMDAMGNSKHYSTQFGIQYSGMGTKSDLLDTKIRMHYIQIPLTFNVKAGYKFINGFFGGGVYGAGTFYAKQEYNDILTGQKMTNEDILSTSWVDDDKVKSFQYFDLGFIFGGGIEVVLPNEHAIQLGIHHYRSLMPVSNDIGETTNASGQPAKYNPGLQNRAVVISVAYLFKK